MHSGVEPFFDSIIYVIGEDHEDHMSVVVFGDVEIEALVEDFVQFTNGKQEEHYQS